MRTSVLLVCLGALLCATLTSSHREQHQQPHSHSHPHQHQLDLSNPDLFLQPSAAAHSHSHPTSIPLDDFHPIKLAPHNPRDTPIYYSYHIHTYFLASNANQTAAAIALRDSFITQFNVSECAGECSTYCSTICHWDLNMEPRGPHPVASFGFYIPLELLLSTQSFMSQNHGDLIVFIHPNSGYPIVDHGLNSFWMKMVMPLDLSQLDPYDPPM